MADVVLAADLLVGDDRERVRLRARPGGRRDRDDRPAGRQVRAVVLRAPRQAARSRRTASIALAASIAEPPPIATTTVIVEPERARSAAAPRSTVAPRRGSARPRRSSTVDAAAGPRRSTRSATPAATTPGSVTMNAREPPAAATSSGSRAIAPDPEPHAVAQRRSRSAGRPAAVIAAGPRGPGRRSCRGGPSASAGSRTRGTSARSSRRRGSRRSRPRRSRASSASVIESGTSRRSPPNVNSSSGRRPQRGQSSQSISASPPSPGRPGRGRARTGRARTARSAPACRPVAMSSAIASPPAGIALKPHVPQPVVTRKPVDAGLAHDRREVDRDVADPGPRAQDPQVAQERQEPGDLVASSRAAPRTTTGASTTAARRTRRR